MAPKKGFVPHNKKEIDINLMKELYFLKGYDYQEIADYFGFKSKSAIYDRFKALGLKARTNSDLKTGTKHSKITKEKISRAGIGRKHTDEAKKKMSERFAGDQNPMHGKFGSKNPNWKGGYISKAGYRVVCVKGKQVLEHRDIWETHNKKNIPRGYQIHHINRKREDNRIENLRLMKEEDHIKLHYEKRGRNSFGRFK
jgi:hypothetical protein